VGGIIVSPHGVSSSFSSKGSDICCATDLFDFLTLLESLSSRLIR
jgi:hypothetical protein